MRAMAIKSFASVSPCLNIVFIDMKRSAELRAQEGPRPSTGTGLRFILSSENAGFRKAWQSRAQRFRAHFIACFCAIALEEFLRYPKHRFNAINKKTVIGASGAITVFLNQTLIEEKKISDKRRSPETFFFASVA